MARWGEGKDLWGWERGGWVVDMRSMGSSC